MDDPDHTAVSSAESLAAVAYELGESVNGRPENVGAALPQLESILAQSDEVEVVVETVIALGHAWDRRAVEMILDRVAVDHPDAAVRLEVARALSGGFDRYDACWTRAEEALIALSGDSEAEVRDWACFGLGQVGASSAAARDALALRLTDPDHDTRCEALRALAVTGDDRALRAVGERLAVDDSDDIYRLELEAAAERADPTLYPTLIRLQDDWRADDDDLMPVLAFAIRRCEPAARSEAEKVERALAARVNELLAVEPFAANLTASLAGQYPRTILTVLGPTGAAVAGHEVDVWDEQEPGTYRLEQEAQNVVLAVRNAQRQ